MERLQSLLMRSACGLVFIISLTSMTWHVHAVEQGCMKQALKCFNQSVKNPSCAFTYDQKQCLSVDCCESDSQVLGSVFCKTVKFNDVLNTPLRHCARRLSAGCLDVKTQNWEQLDFNLVIEEMENMCDAFHSQRVTTCLTSNKGEQDPGCTHDELDRLSGAICDISAASQTTVMTSFAVLASFLVLLMNSTSLLKLSC